MVKSLKRHLETTPEFKLALMAPLTKPNANEYLEKLGLDFLFNSPNLESQQVAIETASQFLRDPEFPSELVNALTTEPELIELGISDGISKHRRYRSNASLQSLLSR